jgi:predicted SprT family Zn-dependent metalloprotease
MHEAAHLLAWQRGLKDTTARGAYHNQTYLALAEEVGLTWPADRERRADRGYHDPEISNASRTRYAAELEAIEAAIPTVLPYLKVPAAKSRTPDRLGLACGCKPEPRRIRASKTVVDLGPIICGVCGKEFKPTS